MAAVASAAADAESVAAPAAPSCLTNVRRGSVVWLGMVVSQSGGAKRAILGMIVELARERN